MAIVPTATVIPAAQAAEAAVEAAELLADQALPPVASWPPATDLKDLVARLEGFDPVQGGVSLGDYKVSWRTGQLSTGEQTCKTWGSGPGIEGKLLWTRGGPCLPKNVIDFLEWVITEVKSIDLIDMLEELKILWGI